MYFFIFFYSKNDILQLTFRLSSLGLGRARGDESNSLISDTSFSIDFTSVSMASTSYPIEEELGLVHRGTRLIYLRRREKERKLRRRVDRKKTDLTAAACSIWESGVTKLSCMAATRPSASDSCSRSTVMSHTGEISVSMETKP